MKIVKEIELETAPGLHQRDIEAIAARGMKVITAQGTQVRALRPDMEAIAGLIWEAIITFHRQDMRAAMAPIQTQLWKR